MDDGLVQGRVEDLAGRGEGFDPDARERGAEFLAHQPHTLQQGVVLVGGLERAVEVVEGGEQLLGELDRAALQRERGLARDAAAVVLEVGLGALGQREVLVALGGDRDELVEVALDLGRVTAAGTAGAAPSGSED